MRAPLLAVLFAAGFARAEDLSADTAGAIQHDQAAAQEKVDAKYGNKKNGDMSREERAQYDKDTQAARQGVLDKHGVSDKDYSRYEARMSKGDRAGAKATSERMTAKDKADAEKEAAAKKQGGPKEIQVQRGFGDGNPVQMDGKDGEPTVERGVPGSDADEKPKSKHHGKKSSRNND